MATETCNRRALLAGVTLLALAAALFSQVDGPTGTTAQTPPPELFVHMGHLADPSLRQGIDQLVTVDGQEWPLGETVTLTIDDPSTTVSPDYIDSQTVTSGPLGETVVSFELNGVFDVQPGHVVTLSNDTTTKTHIVRNLTVTSVALAADTVSGTAEPGSDVVVQIWAPFPHPIRQEVADPAGNWTASFATPGDAPDEQDTYDIRHGTNGQAGQFDAGGGTLVDFQVPADAVAALRVLQFVAGLPGGIGADMDCDGDIDAVDALAILRFVAGLPVNLPPGCPPIIF